MIMNNLLKSMLEDDFDTESGLNDNNDFDFAEVIKKSTFPHSFEPIPCIDGIDRVYTED